MKQNKKQCYEVLLTYRCNAQCLFCSQGSFNKTITSSFENVVKQIYQAKKEGYVRLGLSGGEPTIREDLVEIIKVAKKIGFDFIRIQTNGIRLKDYSFCEKLVDAGLTFCKFSFTTHRSDIHNKLVNIRYAWEDAMQGLKNMRKLKVRLGNNILITKYNYKELKNIVRFFLNEGVSNFVVIYPIYVGNMEVNKKIGVSLPSCKKYFIDTLEFMEKNNLSDEILFLNVPPCILDIYYESAIGLSPFNTVVTSPDGLSVNLDEDVGKMRSKGRICKNCYFYNDCKGVDIKYIETFDWKGFKPVKYFHKKDSKRNYKTSEEYLTDNERCLIEILKSKNNINVERVLEIAKKIPLCYDCNDGNNVINTAMRLANKNIIKISFKNGKYYLKLEDRIRV